jgi:hypothetical protein
MIPEVHQQTDKVWVRADSGLYQDTPENFALDCAGVGISEALPDLPSGAVERIYQQGVRHPIQDAISVVAGGEMPWPLGDEIIAAIDHLLAAQEARQPAPKKISPQDAKRREIEEAYAAHAFGGFESTALGPSHFYLIDQTEMTAAVVHALKTTPVWCRDESGVWALRNHRLAQLTKAFDDFRKTVLAAQRKRADLLAQIDEAADLDAIKW